MEILFKNKFKILSLVIIISFFVGIMILTNKNKDSDFQSSFYYFGTGAKDLDFSEITKLTKVSRSSTPSFMITVSPVGEVWYFAYPDSYPALTSIRDQNGFELIADFKVTTGHSIIDLPGDKTTYRVYEYNNVTTLSDYKVTYLQ